MLEGREGRRVTDGQTDGWRRVSEAHSRVVSRVTELLARLVILLMASGTGRVKQSAATAALIPSNTFAPANLSLQVMESEPSGRSAHNCKIQDIHVVKPW